MSFCFCVSSMIYTSHPKTKANTLNKNDGLLRCCSYEMRKHPQGVSGEDMSLIPLNIQSSSKYIYSIPFMMNNILRCIIIAIQTQTILSVK